MSEVIRRLGQAAVLWAVAAGVLRLLWAPALGFAQLWMVIGIGILTNVLQPSYTLFGGPRPEGDRGTFDQIIGTVYLTQAAALLEVVAKRPPRLPFDALSAVALGAMIAGLALRTWAIAVLGKFFTLKLQVQAGQRIVDIGPYRVIRHPSYAGALLTFVAACVLLRSWVAAGVAAIALTIAFRRRIRHEERLLLDTFPEYAAYAARTGALFPRMRRLPRAEAAGRAGRRDAAGRGSWVRIGR